MVGVIICSTNIKTNKMDLDHPLSEQRYSSPKINHVYEAIKLNTSNTKPSGYQNALIYEIKCIASNFLEERETEDNEGYTVEDNFKDFSVDQALEKYQNKRMSLQPRIGMGTKHDTNATDFDDQTPRSKNLYDKYKWANISKQERNLNSSREKICEEIKTGFKPTLNAKPRYAKVQSKVNTKELNYQKFVDRNVKQKVKEEHQVRKNQDKEHRVINVHNGKRYQQVPIKFSATQRQVKRSVENLMEKSHQLVQRRTRKVEQLRDQQIMDEMNGVTFKPEVRVNKYNKYDQSLPQQGRLDNFENRLEFDHAIRLSNEKKIIEKELNKSSFVPKTNQNISAQSITKAIWNSPSKPKLVVAQRSQSFLSEGKELESTKVSLKTTNEVTFLFQ